MKYYRSSFDVIDLGSGTHLVHCTEERTGISRVYTVRDTDIYVSSWDVWTAAQNQDLPFVTWGALNPRARAGVRSVFLDELDRYANPRLL